MSQSSLTRWAAQVKPARKHAGDCAHLWVMPLVAYLLTASHLATARTASVMQPTASGTAQSGSTERASRIGYATNGISGGEGWPARRSGPAESDMQPTASAAAISLARRSERAGSVMQTTGIREARPGSTERPSRIGYATNGISGDKVMSVAMRQSRRT
jgi:hypothetical protein